MLVELSTVREWLKMENAPDSPEEIVDILGKIKVLNIEDENLSISLESHNQVNIQPKGTPLGAKVKVEENGNITPTLTFDTKKLREPKKNIDAKKMLDDALEDFFNGQI